MRTEEPNTIVRDRIAYNLRTLRDAANISQSCFASMINVNRSHLNRIECGEENITLDTMVKIADGLDVSLPDLLEGLGGCPPRELPEKHFEYGVTPFPPSNGDNLQGRS